MHPALAPSAASLAQLIATCEVIYQRDGFVRWVDVAKVLGVSRQAVQLRLRRAIELGQIEQSTYDRWESMSSRRTAVAQRAKEKKLDEGKRNLRVMLTQENSDWLNTECDVRNCTRADIVNGLITKARIS